MDVPGSGHVITAVRISPKQYHLGRILNEPIPGYGFDFGLQRAGISVDDTLDED